VRKEGKVEKQQAFLLCHCAKDSLSAVWEGTLHPKHRRKMERGISADSSWGAPARDCLEVHQ
jgi:hypothetical protein